jgi:amino acid transporter
MAQCHDRLWEEEIMATMGVPVDRGPGAEALGLRQGALGVWSIMAQSVGHITPLLGLFVGFAFISSFAGAATPICFGVGAILLAMAAVGVGQVAKHFPSSSGFYAYVSRTIHPRAGLFIAWIYVLFDPLQAGIVYPFMGIITEQVLKSAYGIYVPWWIVVAVACAFNAAASWFGIQISGRTLLVTSIIELIVMLGLGGWGIFNPGPGGFNFSSFNPGTAPSISGIGFGILFTVSVYAGWESSAPLAEESHQPRRIIPFAMVASIALIGLIDVLVTWGLTLGWGTSKAASLATSVDSPLFVLAKHFWGPFFLLIMFGFWNSCLAGCQAFFNTSTRMEYGMAKAGVLPKAFTKIHPKYKTPTFAILFQVVLTLVIAYGWSAWPVFGPMEPIFFEGYALSIALFLIYAAANIGVIRFFLTERRSEFNIFLHFLFPVVSTGALAWATWLAVVPLPSSVPLNFAPAFFLVWFAIGIVGLVVVELTGNGKWLTRAAEAAVNAAPIEEGFTMQYEPQVKP